MLFSVSNKAFYSEDIDYGDSLPDDVISLTDSEYQKYFEALSSERTVYEKGGELNISKKKPSVYHSWDSDSAGWVVTEESEAKKAEDESTALVLKAKSELSRATEQIEVLTDKVSLGEYLSGETEASVNELILAWRKYRVMCNSAIAGSSNTLGDAPDAAT